MRFFITTVDTESDWFSFKKNSVTNIVGIHYLQEICDKYSVKPTYLITYEMATNNESVSILKKYSDLHLCEIGHHLHVWSTPPFFKANSFGVEEYLIGAIQAELPDEIFNTKMLNLHNAIEKNFGLTPRSHRAGKWGIDLRTMRWLENHNYFIDTSLTPFRSLNIVNGLKSSLSFHNTRIPNHPYFPSSTDITRISGSKEGLSILEVPVTGIKGDIFHVFKGASIVRHFAYKFGYKGFGNMMFRPSDVRIPLKVFEHITRKLFESDLKLINFMFHSNELCLGTSPYSKNEFLTEQVHAKIECAFRLAHEYGYKSIFLRDSLTYYEKE